MDEPTRGSAAILAGGRARRLGGVQKGLVTVGGETIVSRQLRLLKSLAFECAIVAGDLAPYKEVAAHYGARLVRDRHSGRGPLAGLDAALAYGDGDSVILLACDLPFLDGELITMLRDRSPAARALVPRVEARPQPLAARYARAIAPTVKSRLERGELAMMALLDELEPEYVDLPATRALHNINTPEDLARAEELAKEI